MKTLSPLFVFLALATSQVLAGWHDRKAEGWAWYEDKSKPHEIEEEAPEEDKAPPASPPMLSEQEIAAERVKEIRKDLEQRLALALLQPTPENIASYLERQKRWVDHSALFSTNWTRLVMSRPDLDQTLTTPVSQYGQFTYKEQQAKKRSDLIKELATTHGLFFFFKGDCSYAQAFAPILKQFELRNSWAILPISLDGKGLSEYPASEKDANLAEAFEVTTSPALFVVNSETNEITPIGYGLLTLDQIETNIETQFSEEFHQ